MEPTEMEERVAQAICCPRGICHPGAKTRSGGCVARLNYLHGARAAIKAMREPTQSMLLAGARSIGSTMSWENHMERSKACHQAMHEGQ